MGKSPAHVLKDWMRRLIIARCSGDLLEAVDWYYEEHSQSKDVSMLVNHLQEEFLGMDDK